jgi:predicted nucleic acid-binding Zn ribbon protein
VRDRLAPQTALAEIQGCWREAVGESIAAHAQPSSERGGVLTVSCDASVWAQELDLLGPQIARRLNELLGSEHVVRLRCVSLPGQS